jgi:cytochrome P450
MRADPLAFVSRLRREFGDVVCVRMGPLRVFMVFHPEGVKHVLQDNHRNYVKGPLIARARVLIGDGLFTSEGDLWRRQRRLAQPAFHHERLAGLVDVITRLTGEHLHRWHPVGSSPPLRDIAAEMSTLTLTIAGITLFGENLEGEAAAAGRALRVALEFTGQRIMSYLAVPLAIPTARNLAFRRAVRILDDVVYDIIASRQRSRSDAGDLLSMLLAARDEETGAGMTRRQLRDEVMTFFLAGHETTAVTLAWTWYLLARHPAIEARLREESVAGLGTGSPTYADLPHLRFTRMVIQEAMRLYPPVWGIGRQALEEDTIGGYRVPRGGIVNLSPYVTHRHPDVWNEPERFDPERFDPARAASRHRFAYFPFGGGPRLCIGEAFALMEAQVIVAMVAGRYRLRPRGGYAAEPEVHLTLRPRGGMPMTIAPEGSSIAGAAR